MRGLYLLALLSVVAASENTWSRQRYAMARLAAEEAKLKQLEKRLDKIKHTIEDEHDDYTHHVDQLEHRLEHIEGNDCHDHQFSCGRKSGQCIADLLVCDDVPDCDNGHDEDEKVCEDVVPIGRSWSGRAVWKGCSMRHTTKLAILITGHHDDEDFHERHFVDAVVIEKYSEDGEEVTHSYPTQGFYNFANRHLQLDPPESSERGLALDCWDAGDALADCAIVRSSDGFKCGHALLTRSI